ncbi:MAG: saccharopine dehydrogenase NADP-binding domain-containing protein [Ignavibacteriae bacterium]|nr:saccharopine dehydrogenase NADP-binding domain-containing protein [Ignavibacteriota bacterium]
MKKVLILGAGQSAPFLIQYLLTEAEKNNWFVTVCDRDVKLAERSVNNHPNGNAIDFDVNDEIQRENQIKNCDIVVNFLAPMFQFLIATECVKFKKHMVTASYENPKVAELNSAAVENDILILNEMGLDPGIDNMSAMKILTAIREKDGEIKSFISYGSALPAPEVKSNPLNYCITWNPANVVTAGEAGAQYLENGKMKILPYHQVFNRTWNVEIENLGKFEAYPNRDSLLYQKVFKLENSQTVIRGTLRNPGWAETWIQLIKLGLTQGTLLLPEVENLSYRDFTEMYLPQNISGTNLELKIANYLGINPTGIIMKNLEFLGLFSNEKIGSNFKNSVELMTELIKRKLPLPKGERDMVILHHEIEAEYPNNKKEKIISTLVDYGDPKNNMTAIAKTVGAPAAIAVKLLLQNELKLKGCHIPTHPEIYPKILNELKMLNLEFCEKRFEIN